MKTQNVDVLVVEDDPEDFARLNGMLDSLDEYQCAVTWAPTHAEAKALVQGRRFDALLLDYWLDGGNSSLDLIAGRSSSVNGMTPAIIVTSSDDHDREAVRAGVVDYLSKERLDRLALERTLRHALDRKRVERELRASEQRFRGLVSAVAEMVWTTEPDGSPKDSIAWVEYTGMPAEQMVREGWLAAVHPQDVPIVLARWRESMESGRPYETMVRLRRHDGVYRWFWGHSVALRDESGAIREWIGIAMDIDDQRQSEDALWRSNQRLLEVVRLQQEISRLATDRLAIKRLVAERVRGLVGADAVAVARIEGEELVYPTLVGATTLEPLRVGARGSLIGWSAIHRRSMRCDDLLEERASAADAALIGMRSALYVPLVAGDQAIGVLSAMSQAPAAFGEEQLHTLELLAGILASALANAGAYEARVESEQALAFQAKLLASVQQAVMATDLQGRITYWNAYSEKQFGWTATEALGRSASELVLAPGFVATSEEIGERVLRGEDFLGDYELKRRDGSRFTALTGVTLLRGPDERPLGFIGVSRDVTNERALEEQLRHSQKLQAVGQLAGGVAHDFNNILTAITSYAELVFDAVQAPELRSDLDEIRHAARRGADLTRQLLAFSRKQVLQPVAFDAAAVVRTMEGMLRRLVREDVALVVAVPDGMTLPLYADPSQLEQVLLNLVVNARDAIPDAGRIVIRLAHTPSGHMALEVSDTGEGMTEDTKARLFEPFFTTKPAGKGTGLGLAVVHGIVQQMKGTIAVESAPGNGTRFMLTFPLAAEATLSGDARRASRPQRRLSGGTVLLVEDNAALLLLCQRILERDGFDVLCASTPEDALATAQTSRVDLVITDVVMPEMNGPTMVDRLAEQGLTAPVIFMSGYTEDAFIDQGRARDRSAFLPKPFTPAELVKTVRRVLESDGSRLAS